MEDVQNKDNVEQQPVESVPTEAPQAEENNTQEEPVEQTAKQEAVERMVPLTVVQKERKQRQELQRKVAELENKQKMSGYDPADMETIMATPFVQELLVKQAKQELTDYARELLDTNYPNIHPIVKKAILKNARGFVNEATTDVETAKLDLQSYVEEIAEDPDSQVKPEQPAPKQFKVAQTNVSQTSTPGVRPADIQKILNKPIDEWTEDETAKVELYAQSNK